MTAFLIAAGLLLVAVLTFIATVWAVGSGALEVYMMRHRNEHMALGISFFRWGFVYAGGDVVDFFVRWKQ
jgi:hypothetical protein